MSNVQSLLEQRRREKACRCFKVARSLHEEALTTWKRNSMYDFYARVCWKCDPTSILASRHWCSKQPSSWSANLYSTDTMLSRGRYCINTSESSKTLDGCVSATINTEHLAYVQGLNLVKQWQTLCWATITKLPPQHWARASHTSTLESLLKVKQLTWSCATVVDGIFLLLCQDGIVCACRQTKNPVGTTQSRNAAHCLYRLLCLFERT